MTFFEFLDRRFKHLAKLNAALFTPERDGELRALQHWVGGLRRKGKYAALIKLPFLYLATKWGWVSEEEVSPEPPPAVRDLKPEGEAIITNTVPVAAA